MEALKFWGSMSSSISILSEMFDAICCIESVKPLSGFRIITNGKPHLVSRAKFNSEKKLFSQKLLYLQFHPNLYTVKKV